ncbi:hypothetical protein BX265_7024 [Streptomyces sp. TLI_235]|nr:hypothetical protein [Streptomyces sp. TLI_235]PBC69683.1 hypothetical protein BX265_7024 [Streptomyces sp. TLI_235]
MNGRNEGPVGVHCGGIDCHHGHLLSEPWDATQQRAVHREPCIDKGTPRPDHQRMFGRRDPDERAADAYSDDYLGPPLDR